MWKCLDQYDILEYFGNVLGYSVLEMFVTFWYGPQGHQYSAGTSFSAPQSITEKSIEVSYLDEWIIITLHVAGFLHPALF